MRALAVMLFIGCAEHEGVVEQDVTARQCPAGETVEGIDVSEYQGSVDWKAVKASGRVFGIARINVGDHVDPTFAANWSGMKAAGLVRGAYQYYKPSFDAAAQAKLVVDTVGVLGDGDLPAMLDIETTSGVAPAAVIAKLETWLGIVEAGTGKRPLVYTGAYFWDDNLKSAALASYPLVIPWYGTTCPGVPDAWERAGWLFHQYSETGTVPGVASNPTDLDVFNGSEAALRAMTAPPRACVEAGVIDDGDPCFVAGGPAKYLRRVSNAGEGGTLIWTHATAEAEASNFAEWRLRATGRFRIEVATPAPFAQSKQARYVVRGVETTEVMIDQTAVDGWQSLGVFELGGDGSVRLGDNTGETAVQLVFDAVRLTPVADDDVMDGGGCSVGGGAGLVIGLLALRRRRRGHRCQRQVDGAVCADE